MLKKLNLFALTLLLVGQTILGPIATVSAESVVPLEQQSTEPAEAPPVVAEPSEDNTPSGGEDLVITPEPEKKPEAPSTPETPKAPETPTTPGSEQGDAGASEGESSETDGEISADHQDDALTQAGVEDDEDDILTSAAMVYPDIILNDNNIDKTKTSFMINGTPVTGSPVNVRNGDKARFDIALNQISNNPLTYDVGTKLRYALPAGFTDVFDTITISSEMRSDKGRIASVERVGNEIVMTLEKGIHDVFDQPETIKNASFFIEAHFAADNTEWDNSITIPGGTTIDLVFQPKKDTGVTINKKSTTPSGQLNIDQIEWEVTVNTNRSNTTEDLKFTDVLTAIGEDSTSSVGHKFKKDSFMLYEIPVTPAGVGSPITPGTSITPDFEDNDTKVEYELTKGKAYKITYSTIPDNPFANEWIKYINEAHYGTIPAGKKEVQVNYGKAIEKTGSGPGAAPGLKASWTIKYNYNNQTIPVGTKLEDEWDTAGGKKIVDGDPAYQEMENLVVKTDSGTDLVKGTHYELAYTSGSNAFELTFIQPVTEPLIITYDTKPVNYAATPTFTVENTATRPDISKSDDATVTYSQTALALVKERGASIPNYHDKTMDWKITANQGGYQLDAGTQFVDEFTNHANTTMTLKPETLQVKIGDDTYTEATPEADRKYTLSGSTNQGFTITLKEPTRGKNTYYVYNRLCN